MNRADLAEIQARIEKVNKEYEVHIQPIVIGEFRGSIESEVKQSKKQFEDLKGAFCSLIEELKEQQEKVLVSIEQYSRLK